MARPLRIITAGQPAHVIHRGINRQAVFRSTADYEYYLELLAEAMRRSDCATHAYALMPNHVHLLVTPCASTAVSRLMQDCAGGFARYFNRKYGRTGGLWEDRFRSCAIDSDYYYFACSRYIEMNPARAGIVADPREYRWSSAAANMSGQENALVTPHELYLRLGANPGDRRSHYAALFGDMLGDEVLVEIRHAIRRGRRMNASAVPCTADVPRY